MTKTPVVDYRKLRLRNLTSPQFRHLLYLLYWPLYGILFLTVERLWIRPYYFPISCPLDSRIPFCEFFLIPYLFWFVFLIGIHLYTLLYDVDAFRGLMKFIIVSYSLAIGIYILFPNCQELRPLEFPRDNLFTRFLANFYQFDTNTNVFPSVHVIGSIAVVLCAWRAEGLRTPVWRTAFCLTGALISVSTVFLKQHSILDVLGGLAVCGVSYALTYGKEKRSSK